MSSENNTSSEFYFDLLEQIHNETTNASLNDEIVQNSTEYSCDDLVSGMNKMCIAPTAPRQEEENKDDVCKSVSKKCVHVYEVCDGVKLCTICGTEFERVQTFEKEWKYYGPSETDNIRCTSRKAHKTSIYKDLEGKNIDPDIINSANNMYIQISNGKVFRGRSTRKSIISGCLFYAYKIRGTPKSCDMIRIILSDFKLRKSDILHGIKYISLNIPKSSGVQNVFITPTDVIVELLETINNKSQKTLDDIMKLYSSIIEKDPMRFMNNRPQSVAASVIYYYTVLNNRDIDIAEFSKLVGTSVSTIQKIVSGIKDIHLGACQSK